MKRSQFNGVGLVLIGLMFMGVSPSAWASGDIMLVYYAAGALLLQLALLGVTYVQWRGNRLIAFAIYVAVSAAAWCLALNARADFYPLATAMAVAVLPWAICVAFRTLLVRAKRNEVGRR